MGGTRGKICQARADNIPTKGQVTALAVALGAERLTGDRWLQKNTAIHF